MDASLQHVGLMQVCEICDGEVELGDDRDVGAATCRHCGIVFLIDAPYGSHRRHRGA